jgi:hypothetical protein
MAVNAVHHVWLGDEDLGIFDEEKFSLQDAFTIKASCGLGVKEFMAGINDLDPLAVQAFVWWLKFRKGAPVDRASLDFPLSALRMEDEPDPTQAATTGDGVANILEPSPASSTSDLPPLTP